jgi:hypothetical protein
VRLGGGGVIGAEEGWRRSQAEAATALHLSRHLADELATANGCAVSASTAVACHLAEIALLKDRLQVDTSWHLVLYIIKILN